MIFLPVFITNDLPHKHFVRSGQNLISTYSVTIEEMMFGVQFIIHTIDNKQLRVNITQVITYVPIISLYKKCYKNVFKYQNTKAYTKDC